MKQRIIVIVVGIVWAASLLGLGLLNAGTPLASAHTVPVVVVERSQQNNATWTVQEPVFESNYPEGFTVRVNASSSGGEIARARLIWSGTKLRESETRQVNGEEGEINPETGEITASWAPSEIEMIPPWSLLHYYWEFRDSAGNTYQTEPVETEYADNTHEWTRSESEDAIVLTLDLEGDIESMVLDALAQQHDQYVEVWGAALPYKPRIVLFGDYDTWLEWRTVQEHSDNARIVGQTFDEWGVIVQVLFGMDQEAAMRDLAYSTVPHETEHLYQAEFYSGRTRYDVPGWFIEGDATFFELVQSYDYEGRIREMAANGELPPLLVANIADAPRVDGDNPREGYDIGYTFFVWMEQLRGDLSAHREIRTLLGENVPFFEALETVTGMTIQEIERDWRLWLGASEVAPTLMPTWTPPAIPLIVTPVTN